MKPDSKPKPTAKPKSKPKPLAVATTRKKNKNKADWPIESNNLGEGPSKPVPTTDTKSEITTEFFSLKTFIT